MKTYDVTLTREGKWWMVSIPEIDGLTQAKTIGEAHQMARDYIAITLDVPAESFGIHVHAEQIGRVEHVTQLLEDIRIARVEAERFEREAADKSRELAARLAAEDIPLREIGAVMGVSHQRADQLVRGGTQYVFVDTNALLSSKEGASRNVSGKNSNASSKGVSSKRDGSKNVVSRRGKSPLAR